MDERTGCIVGDLGTIRRGIEDPVCDTGRCGWRFFGACSFPLDFLGWAIWLVAAFFVFAAIAVADEELRETSRNSGTVTLVRSVKFRADAGSFSVYWLRGSNWVRYHLISTSFSGDNLSGGSGNWSFGAENFQLVAVPAIPKTIELSMNADGSNSFFAVVPYPAKSVGVTYNMYRANVAYFDVRLPDHEIVLSSSGEVVSETPPLDFEPPAVSEFADIEGDSVFVPYVLPAGEDSVEVEIGGEILTYEFGFSEFDRVVGLDVTIPAGWDGVAKIGGESVDLGAFIARNPSGKKTADVYGPRDPAGLPAGVSYVGSGENPLPAGVVRGDRLPLPSGVTSVSSGFEVGGSAPVVVERVDGVKTVTVPKNHKPTSVGGGSSGSGGSAIVGTGSTGDASLDSAVMDAGIGVPEPNTVIPPESVENYGISVDGVRADFEAMIGGFEPMTTGDLPKMENLSFTFNAGRFGSRDVSLDLTGEPFRTARLIALVFVIFWAWLFFYKFMRV